MKCVLLLCILAAASASQERKPLVPTSGYSYYVSSSWPSSSHQIKKPPAPSRKETIEVAREESSGEGNRDTQSNALRESKSPIEQSYATREQSYAPKEQSYFQRDDQTYGRKEERYHSENDYGYRDDYYKVIGRHGLGFEKRIASADGLRMPITPESLQHIGKRPTFKELKYVPL